MNSDKLKELYQVFTSRVLALGTHLESGVLQSESELVLPYATRARRIYDLGTGQGRMVYFLARNVPSAQLHGIDAKIYQHLSGENIHFVKDDILHWLQQAFPAELILCLGNTLGGFLDEGYRNDLFAEVIKKIELHGHVIIDYRPVDTVLREDTVLERIPQMHGEIIITEENISGHSVPLPQFYPDATFPEYLNMLGFGIVKSRMVTKAKFARKALVLEKEVRI